MTIQSGAVTLTPVTMNNVVALILDTGANDTAADADDTITINSAGGVLPHLSLLPGVSGKDTMQVNGPVTLENNPLQGSTPTLTIVTNAPAAIVTFLAPRVDLAALSLQEGLATIASSGDKVLVTKSLNIGPQATLDIADNSVIVDFDPPSPIATLISQIQSGYQPGVPTHWNGVGITSSIAANDSKKAIGYADSGALLGSNGGMFMGVQVDNSAVLMTFTLVGDANLNRKVNFADLVAVAQHYGQSGTHWISGDLITTARPVLPIWWDLCRITGCRFRELTYRTSGDKSALFQSRDNFFHALRNGNFMRWQHKISVRRFFENRTDTRE